VGSLGAFADALAARALGRPEPGLGERVEALAAPLAGGARRPDGSRAATLTAAGIPMEASVTGRRRMEPMVRVAIEPATGVPFFGPRERAWADAVEQLLADLDPPADVAADVRDLVAVAYPDPAAVPARTPGLAGSVGVVHHADVAGLAGMKVYAHVRPDPHAHHRLTRRWPELDGPLTPLDGRWQRHAVAFDADVRGRLTRKTYVRSTRPLERADLHDAVEAAVPGSAWVLDVLEKAGAHGRIGRASVYLCRTVVAPGERPVATLYWGVHGHRWADAEPVLRVLARELLGSELAVDVLVGAGRACGAPWTFTIAGVGLVPEGEDPRLNLYACPAALTV